MPMDCTSSSKIKVTPTCVWKASAHVSKALLKLRRDSDAIYHQIFQAPPKNISSGFLRVKSGRKSIQYFSSEDSGSVNCPGKNPKIVHRVLQQQYKIPRGTLLRMGIGFAFH